MPMPGRYLSRLTGRPLVHAAAVGAATLMTVAATLAGVPVPAAAQERADPAAPTDSVRVEWLRHHAATIRTLDPGDDDFSDLAAFGRAIGDARVVFLGEPSHTTGNLFSAQARLVKYLHQQHGFDVLVFESGLYDVAKVWEAVRAGESAHEAFRRGIFRVWSDPVEVRPLMEYVASQAQGPRPLELAGYDAQFSGSFSQTHLRQDLETYLQKLGVADAFAADSALWQGLRRLHPRGAAAGAWPPDSVAVAPLLPRLASVRDSIRSHADDHEGGFWLQVLESAAAYGRQSALMKADQENWAPFFNVRDEQGARNLLWLADERYRGRKLIVWLATIHAARNLGDLVGSDTDFRNVFPTGHHVWQALGPRMYTLGMVALEGESGWSQDETWPIVADQRPEAELEELLAEAGFEMAFLDYRNVPAGGEWLRGPLASRPFGNSAEVAESWPNIIDGLLFVRVGTPATLPPP
jgi:erythromycin esterase